MNSETKRDRLIEIGEAHLPKSAHERWRQLLEPAVYLEHAADGDSTVGYLGGEAFLPEEMAWPEWEEYGPLTLWATIDCAALPRLDLDLDLPESGKLLFFLADGQLWESSATPIGYTDGVDHNSHRVVYLPEGTPVSPRPHPARLHCVAEAEPLTARIALSGPWMPAHAWFERYGDSDTDVLAVLEGDDFNIDLELWGNAGTHLGGHHFSLQNDTLEELVQYGVFEGEDRGEAAVTAEMARWRLLLQFFPFADTKLWCGDYTHAYWFITAEDLTARRFDRSILQEQCT
ncbi:DUF1963 domain-containing protein [Glycomyces buryatensis]|nr:YwqG family protein [Glycomyces buryatensis]